jgi:hypothetical protein
MNLAFYMFILAKYLGQMLACIKIKGIPSIPLMFGYYCFAQ